MFLIVYDCYMFSFLLRCPLAVLIMLTYHCYVEHIFGKNCFEKSSYVTVVEFL